MNTRVTWTEYREGTWLPSDHNEFHNCSLWVGVWDDVCVRVHKTKDGKHWTASAYPNDVAMQQKAKLSGPSQSIKKTRKSAFWEAFRKCKRVISERSKMGAASQ